MVNKIAPFFSITISTTRRRRKCLPERMGVLERTRSVEERVAPMASALPLSAPVEPPVSASQAGGGRPALWVSVSDGTGSVGALGVRDLFSPL